MEAPYATRKQQWLAECQVAPESFPQGLPRVETFMAPFVRTCCRQEPAQHAHTYVYGLLSDLERKNVEAIAYRFGHDRLALQRFVGWADWDDAPWRQALTRQVAQQLGHAAGVLVLAPSALPKSGTDSVGVARQWCGRLGTVDNGQGARAGLRLGRGPYLGGPAAVPAQNVDPSQGSAGPRWRAPRPQRLSFATPGGVGPAGAKRRFAAARVKRRR